MNTSKGEKGGFSAALLHSPCAVNQLSVTSGIFLVYLLGGLWQRDTPTVFSCAGGESCPSPLTCGADGACHGQLAPLVDGHTGGGHRQPPARSR